jgi:hypothetical protein
MAQAISNDLIQEVSKFAKILAEKFTPPEFIPGCEVISIADINEYATNNGWVEAVCGQHNQQRVRWKSAETVANGDFIDVLFFQERGIFEAYGVGGSTAIVAAHNLLSATHLDTLAASVVAGDIIYGNATPKWARLAKGTDGQVLTLASGLPSWASAGAATTAWPAPGKLKIGTTEYATLALAVAAAVSGDTIYAGVGTHTADNVTIPAGVNLFGADPFLTIFTTSTSTTCLTFSAGCEAGNFTVTITTNSASTTQAISIASNDVILNNAGYSGTNAGAGASYGCNVSGGTGIELWGNRGLTSKTRSLFISGSTTSVRIFGGTFATLGTDSGTTPALEFATPPRIASASFGTTGPKGFYAVNGGLVTPALSGGGQIQLTTGAAVSMFDTDGTLAGNSDARVATQKATKAYVDSFTPPAASESASGIAELATQAETDAGTDDLRIVTPLKLANTSLTERAYQSIPYNGSFAVWQRGTSFAAVADGAYTADGWKYRKTAGVMVHTISQSSDVPTVAQAGILAPYSLLVDCTTVDASIASTDLCTIGTRIEGFDFAQIAQRIFTCSFWVKATKTGIYCISFRNSGADRSYVAEFTINTTATWEYKTITVAASPSAGTWDYTTGLGLTVEICLAGGSNYNTTAGAWQTGSFLSTSNQVNGCDDTANDFRIALFDIVPGSYDRPFPVVDHGARVGRCKRYYDKSYDLATAPATATNVGARSFQTRRAIAGSAAGSQFYSEVFSVPMRAAPTVVLYALGGTANAITVVASTRSGCTAGDVGEKKFRYVAVDNTSAQAIAADDVIAWHYTASAEL